MILFMPWPVQKYITTHLYIIAEFVEWSKWGRRGLLLHFALLHTHCALIPNCFALLSRFARYSRIAPHFVLPQFCAAFTLRLRYRRQDASKLFYIEFSRISKLNLCFTARITAARMLGMAKLSLEVPSQVHQQAFSLCQMLQILCCGST